MPNIKLTQYSHGAGCGCKIAPDVLDRILSSNLAFPNSDFPNLLVGNNCRDDAAAIDIGNDQIILSTTDFFMPIVDDPFDFGRIAATNAISDIYAMGGKPLMAIAILGWPVSTLSPEVASRVIEGGRSVCTAAGIPLAGGHSIDAPEPIFGLAVTGLCDHNSLKRNSAAHPNDDLYLTKGLGIGLLTTAEKQGKIDQSDQSAAVETMCQLNSVGPILATIAGVHALTDVTGFGLAGHLLEVCQASNVVAELNFKAIPLLPNAIHYAKLGCIPGGTGRNFSAFGGQVAPLSELERAILFDPQTSGGLLFSAARTARSEVEMALNAAGIEATRIGQLAQASGQDHAISLLS
jgi:selenide, water dikinase